MVNYTVVDGFLFENTIVCVKPVLGIAFPSISQSDNEIHFRTLFALSDSIADQIRSKRNWIIGIIFKQSIYRDLQLKKIFVGNLSANATEESVTTLFSEFGTVRSIRLVMDVFTRQCRGFGFVEMEGHEARAAIKGLNGRSVDEKPLKVKFEEERPGGRGGRRR